MHVEIVTLQRVFDVQRRGSMGWPRDVTEFSFEADGKRRFAVCVMGRPELVAGHRLAALLGEPGNWQTLAGWKNLSTGELALPQPIRSLAAVFPGVLGMAIGALLYQDADGSLGRMGGGALVLIFLGASLMQLKQWRRERAQVARIRSL